MSRNMGFFLVVDTWVVGSILSVDNNRVHTWLCKRIREPMNIVNDTELFEVTLIFYYRTRCRYMQFESEPKTNHWLVVEYLDRVDTWSSRCFLDCRSKGYQEDIWLMQLPKLPFFKFLSLVYLINNFFMHLIANVCEKAY